MVLSLCWLFRLSRPIRLLLAGYGSANKYALYGALRASAQTISYELAMGLSLVGILLLFNTFSFSEIVAAQKRAIISFSFSASS